MRLDRLCMVAVVTAAVSLPALAQRGENRIPRPRLDDVADTNDYQSYYNAGLELIQRDPGKAAAAFYWASLLNPGSGDALYSRRAALMLDDEQLLSKSFDRGRHRGDRDLRALDSLQFRAMMQSPFLYRRHDTDLLTRMIRNSAVRWARSHGNSMPSETEISFEIDNWLRQGDAQTRAWMSYGNGAFGLALQQYAQALGSARNKAYVHLERGRIFGMQANVDSAVGELRLALAEQQKQDEKELVIFYESKANTDYSIGVLLEGAGDVPGAREAYGQALQEDLSHYSAHMRLGLLAIGLKDTANATSELALAAQLAPNEPNIRYLNGWVLAVSHRYPEAVAELGKAIELDPWYALPYLRMGQVYEQMGNGPKALAGYQAFMAHSAQSDPQRTFAAQRLAEVKDFLDSMPKP